MAVSPGSGARAWMALPGLHSPGEARREERLLRARPAVGGARLLAGLRCGQRSAPRRLLPCEPRRPESAVRSHQQAMASVPSPRSAGQRQVVGHTLRGGEWVTQRGDPREMGVMGWSSGVRLPPTGPLLSWSFIP